MTTRSWWGWGTVEDAVTPAERRELVSRVRAVLPDADLTCHAPPDPSSLDVPPPRISPPGELYSVDVVDRLSHARGQAYRDVTRNLAGVFGPSLEAQLKPSGLTLRHFPQSFEFSTLGGWLATRAGGHYATLYRHVDDLTESLRVVTPVGVSESRRLPGSGAGPSPDRLFLGSEGTLGVIIEAWMRLQSPPVFRAGASVRFASWERAVEATRLIAQSGLHPANCRLLDPAEAFLNAGAASSVLVLAFESASHPVDTLLAQALELCGDGEVVEGAAQRWRKSFLRMPYQRDAMAQHAMITETFETASTRRAGGAASPRSGTRSRPPCRRR